MSTNCKEILLRREGTSQSQRSLSQLQPEYVKLQDYDQADWVLFSYSLAKRVNFFQDNPRKAIDNWSGLFDLFELPQELPERASFEYEQLKKKIKESISEAEKSANLTPHFTLFISFLRLMELTTHRFNGLSKRHLDFYYKDVLRIEKELPKADKVHLVFELAKRIDDYKVADGTGLDGGKDANGKTLVYETLNTLVVNKASVDVVQSIYNNAGVQQIKYAENARSLDGLGAELPEEQPFWFPFAYTKAPADPTVSGSPLELPEGYPELPNAQLGFAIASPMLALAAGKRNFAIEIEFKEGLVLDVFKPDELKELIFLEYSGAKKWVGPIRPVDSADFLRNSEESVTVLSTSMNGNRLRLVYSLEMEDPAVVAYDKEVLLTPLETTDPVAKLYFDLSKPRGYELFRNLVHKPLKEIEIHVSVTGIKDAHIENDTGLLKPNKPFFPFATQPIKNSNFYVDYPEAFSKNWRAFNFRIDWKDAPGSFIDHYYAYRKETSPTGQQTPPPQNQVKDVLDGKGGKILTKNEPKDGVYRMKVDENPKRLDGEDLPELPADIIVNSECYFTVSQHAKNPEEYEQRKSGVQLFNEDEVGKYADIHFYKNRTEFPNSSRLTGPLKITLEQSFLHKEFPRIYALALTENAENPDIPKAPYTPLAEAISVEYSAKESTNFNNSSEADYQDNNIKLFHLTNFGTHEEHKTLKLRSVKSGVLNKSEASHAYLVPDYCQGGELYIGLKDAQPDRQIAILFQVLEGSENPLVDSFSGNQKIQWDVLCNNHWKNVTDDIVQNETDNLLQSGIIDFPIPKQATNNNTRLAGERIWIRAKIHKAFDAVCKLIDLHAQAVKAEFKDQKNDLTHLNNGQAAGTISKLTTRVPQIKSINQPYNSFDFKALEADSNYYRRVSERLRHKNRAITIWDYEHIILEEFPEVYKALCLKHTKDDNYLLPGHVTVVVVPDIINKNVFDIYQPRVSTALLNRIQTHINKLNSLHVEAEVKNPDYEPVRVSLGVRFHKGLDVNFHKKQLQEDITKFLSPWAFDSTQNIAFGTALHSSVVIDYIEELEYVDYLEDLKLQRGEEDFAVSISPSKPGAILVSATEHIINDVSAHCGLEPIIPAETCQY